MTHYAVVGDPIAHSKSPQIHKMFAEQTGEDVIYEKHLVTDENFASFVHSFFAEGGGGLNVTLPHKESAFALAASCTPQAQLAKAVNTLWLESDGSLCGDNTDGAGIVRDLTVNNQVELKGKRVLVLGAGGAARGALAALIETSPEKIMVLNRTLERAQTLQSDFNPAFELEVNNYESLADDPFDVIINATSASIGGGMPPLKNDFVGSDCCCYDMMYSNGPTSFMRWAADSGASKVLDGLGMLVEQAAESFSIWRGVRPDTGPVIENLR